MKTESYLVNRKGRCYSDGESDGRRSSSTAYAIYENYLR